MPQKTLTLANIRDVDQGKVEIAFNQVLRQLCADIQDRPGDPTARKAVMTVELKPELEKDSSALESVGATFHIESKIPKRKTTSYPLRPTGDSAMLFNPESPHDPRQLGLYTDAAPANAQPQPPEAPEASEEPPENMDPTTGEVPD